MKEGYIDSLRGIAILMVIATHVGAKFGSMNSIFEKLATYGRMGVQLFFVVSAVTLCMSMHRRVAEPSATRNFYIRRYFRIAPAYYMGAILYACLDLFRFGAVHSTAFDFIVHAAFLHALFPASFMHVVPGGWSIGVEFAFYFMFPVIYGFCIGGLSIARALLFLVLSSLVSVINSIILVKYLNYEPQLWGYTYWNFLNQLPVFAVGVMLYVLDTKGTLKPVGPLMAFVGVLIFSACCAFFWQSKIELYVVFVPIFSALSFASLFILFKSASFLNFVWLQRIGVASFSIYVFHFAIVETLFSFTNFGASVMGNELAFISSYLLVAVLSYLVARISERHIESRGIQLGRNLIAFLNGKQSPGHV